MEVFEIKKQRAERQTSTASSRGGHGINKVGYIMTMAGIILFTMALLVVIHFTREYTLLSEINQSVDEIKSERLEETRCEEPFCVTKECVYVAATMLDSLNPKADPCTDFYGYACGGYPRVKSIPYAMESFSPARDARMELLIDIRKVMEAAPLATETGAMGKMRKFYESCTNSSARNDLQNQSLSFLLEDLRLVENGYAIGDALDFGHPEPWTKLVSRLEQYRIHTLFKPRFVEIPESAPERIEIDCQAPFLKAEAYMNSSDDELAFQLAIYRVAMSQTFKLLHLDWDARNEFVEEILKIETDIAMAVLDAESLPDTELSEENKQLLKDIWRPVVGDAVQDMTIVSSCEYDLQVILNVLNHTSNKSVVKYVTWRMLVQLLQYLGQAFRDVHVHYLTKLPGTDYAFELRWRECADILRSDFGMLTTKSLIDNGYLKRETFRDVKEVFGVIKQYIALYLGKIEALDDDLRKAFKDKLKLMKLTLGYTDLPNEDGILDSVYDSLDFDDNYFLNVINMKRFQTRKHLTRLWYGNSDDPISGISLDDSPLGSSSGYDYPSNTVRIDIGLLRAPLSVYSDNIPGYLKYGYSSLLAREMSRAYDLKGISYNNAEATRRASISPASERKFLDFQRCLMNQTLQMKSDVDFEADERVFNNIFSDLASFQISHEGVKAHLRSHLSEKPLPGLPLNKKQTFYVLMAQMMCELRDKSASDYEAKLRLPAKYRVNQAIMNMEDFGDVFNCPPNSTMAPLHQCSLIH